MTVEVPAPTVELAIGGALLLGAGALCAWFVFGWLLKPRVECAVPAPLGSFHEVKYRRDVDGGRARAWPRRRGYADDDRLLHHEHDRQLLIERA